MSLYLVILPQSEEEKEIGWVLGRYSDFGFFRDTVEKYFSRDEVPTLLNHEDGNGQWSPQESKKLIEELTQIEEKFKSLPPIKFDEDVYEWALPDIKNAKNLYECFINIDLEYLIEALKELALASFVLDRPIEFQ